MIGSNIYAKIVAKSEALKPIKIPNPTLNVGLVNGERMGSVPQIPFLASIKEELGKAPVKTDTDYGNIGVEKGAEIIPNGKDFYMGSPL